jgi:hypothetical protein
MAKCSIGHQQIGSALFYLVDPSKGTYQAKQGAMISGDVRSLLTPRAIKLSRAPKKKAPP